MGKRKGAKVGVIRVGGRKAFTDVEIKALNRALKLGSEKYGRGYPTTADVKKLVNQVLEWRGNAELLRDLFAGKLAVYVPDAGPGQGCLNFISIGKTRK